MPSCPKRLGKQAHVKVSRQESQDQSDINNDIDATRQRLYGEWGHVQISSTPTKNNMIQQSLPPTLSPNAWEMLWFFVERG